MQLYFDSIQIGKNEVHKRHVLCMYSHLTWLIFEIYWGEILFFIQMHFHNVWCIKNQTKHSSNALLSLVWILMHQILGWKIEISDSKQFFSAWVLNETGNTELFCFFLLLLLSETCSWVFTSFKYKLRVHNILTTPSLKINVEQISVGTWNDDSSILAEKQMSFGFSKYCVDR